MTDVLAPPVELRFPRLYPKQRAFVDDPARYTVCFASTKAGKSVGLLTWILGRAWAIGAPGRDFHWIAPTFPVAKVMYLRMFRWLQRADPDHRVWSSNDTELFIALENGSRIYFKGGDRPDMLYGPDSWGVVIDEGTRVKEEVWHAARSLVTKTEAPIKIVGNMRGRRNWMYRLWSRGESGDPQFSAHRLTAHDAIAGGVLSEEEIRDAESALPEAVFRELYLAEPADDAGNPFGIVAIQARVAPLGTDAPVAWGVDLAKSTDWTVCIGLDKGGCVCRLERFQRSWQDTIRVVRDLVGATPALVDSTGVGDPILEALQQTGRNYEGFKFTQPSKQQLMEGLAVAIQQGRVAYPDGVIVHELEAFEYVYTRTGVHYAAPEGMHDDAVCALALAVEKATRKRRQWGAM